MRSLSWVLLALSLAGGTACTFNSGATRTSPFPELQLGGPQTWSIDGVDFAVEGTHAVMLPGGVGIYAVRYPCEACMAALDGLEEPQRMARAKELTWPLIRYVVEAGRFEQETARVKSMKPVKEWTVGVAIFAPEESLPGVKGAQGYRVQWGLDEVHARVEAEAPAPAE
ncbi:MAG: hypothetical protein H6740_21495 [Alphaproteobacteria bacterium]|nr:hypothetical protein [Alphaproteobacteria bacterium]